MCVGGGVPRNSSEGQVDLQGLVGVAEVQDRAESLHQGHSQTPPQQCKSHRLPHVHQAEPARNQYHSSRLTLHANPYQITTEPLSKAVELCGSMIVGYGVFEVVK